MRLSNPNRLVWVAWGVTTVVSVVTVVLLLVTFSALVASKRESSVTGIPGSQLTAALAATILTSIFVTLFDVLSFFTFLLSLSIAPRRQANGFVLPFVSASYLYLGVLLLITGLILTSNHHWLDQLEAGGWTNADSSAYNGSYIMCFTTCGLFCGMFVVTAVLHRALRSSQLVSLGEAGMLTALRNAAAPDGDSTQELTATGLRPDSALPSDYIDSVSAARRSSGGAWKV